MNSLEVLSAIFGWVYSISWNLSFWPQLILNCRRKKTEGSVIDFPLINTLGFIFYLIYNAALYGSPVIRHEYALRYHGHTPAVGPYDIFFSGHATLVCIIILTQYLLPSIWGFERGPGTNRPSKIYTMFACLCVLVVVIALLIVIFQKPGSTATTSWTWLDVINTMSYAKLAITIVKYFPQLKHNHQSRSTEGWSIYTIVLDLTGGVLSVAQLVIDSVNMNDWSGITGNLPKFVLGNVSIVYDVLFMLQHFCLYRGSRGGQAKGLEAGGSDDRGNGHDEATEEDPLLGTNEQGES